MAFFEICQGSNESWDYFSLYYLFLEKTEKHQENEVNDEEFN